MPNSRLAVPFLEYSAIGRSAQRLIDEYHPSRSLPIPVEDIIDVGLRIEIAPLPGLTRAFAESDNSVVAFINSSLDCITVDRAAWDEKSPRFRFSIAHELAHTVLHRDTFLHLKIDSIEGWKRAMTSIPKDQYARMEWQANAFAGHLLVPMPELEHELLRVVGQARGAGLDPWAEHIQPFICKELGGCFGASSWAVQIRIDKENLRSR